MYRCAAFGLLMFIVVSPFQWAGAADDLEAGRQIAYGVCVKCHQVAPQPLGGEPDPSKPPPFSWIAKRNPEYLDGVLLRPPHPMWGVPFGPGDGPALRAWFEMLSRVPD